MTKKQIKSEFPNEVDTLRTTLAEIKVKLPELDIFLLANPECTKCSNSKDYHCVQLKGKPGCRTCTTRRISCSRHVQYLVETAASRLEWSVEKTKSMYDKHVKQTRTGKKSPSKARKMSVRVVMNAPGSGSKGKRNVDALERDDYGGDSGGGYQDGTQQGPEDLETFSDELEEDEEYDDQDQDPDWNDHTANISHPVSKDASRTSSSHHRALPSASQDETRPQVTTLISEPEDSAGLGSGIRDSISLRTGSVKLVRAQQVDDLAQREDKGSKVFPVVLGSQSEHVPGSNMTAEQRIKQLEGKVAKLNTLRRDDAASISWLTKKADTAFDNMSVLLSRVHMHRQELDTTVSKHIEPTHQKPFKSLIDKMDETSASATRILMLLDKRKNYEIPKTRVPVGIIDEEGEEWVPWDVISDDSGLRDSDETEKKRGRDDEANGTGEGSSKRRKC